MRPTTQLKNPESYQRQQTAQQNARQSAQDPFTGFYGGFYGQADPGISGTTAIIITTAATRTSSPDGRQGRFGCSRLVILLMLLSSLMSMCSYGGLYRYTYPGYRYYYYTYGGQEDQGQTEDVDSGEYDFSGGYYGSGSPEFG